MGLLQKDALDKGDCIAWAAHPASMNRNPNVTSGISALLLLFNEKASTIAMVKHGMVIIQKITSKTNPGQVPVMVVDQPLFTLAKYVQWL